MKNYSLMKNVLLLTALVFIFFINKAEAACTTPSGSDSQTRYDFTAKKMFYCDDTNWVEMGSSGGAPTCVIRSTTSANNSNAKTQTISCLAGETMTSGGCLSDSSPGASLLYNYPSALNVWTCRSGTNGGNNYTLTAYALCCTY